MSHSCKGVVVAVLLVVAARPVRAWQPAKKPAKSKAAPQAGADTVLLVVNGEKITEADLNRSFAYFNVPEDERPRARKSFLDNLIDTRLIQQFLKSRKTAASKQEIDEQIKVLKGQLKQAGLEPDKALEEKGFTNELLREMFAVPLAWKHHVDRAVTRMLS